MRVNFSQIVCVLCFVVPEFRQFNPMLLQVRYGLQFVRARLEMVPRSFKFSVPRDEGDSFWVRNDGFVSLDG